MEYTLMLVFIILLDIISLYIITLYKPRDFCLEKDIYIEHKEIKKRTKRRYFKPHDKQFGIKLFLNYAIVILALIILFTIYIKSEYFFGHNNFLEMIKYGRVEAILSFMFFLLMLMSPVLAIIITVKTIILYIEAYTASIKLEKNHLVYNNRFRTINIFFNKEKHTIKIQREYISGIFNGTSNIIYFKIIFEFENEKRELKLYAFNEDDVLEIQQVSQETL